jgi:hypothetical protein
LITVGRPSNGSEVGRDVGTCTFLGDLQLNLLEVGRLFRAGLGQLQLHAFHQNGHYQYGSETLLDSLHLVLPP